MPRYADIDKLLETFDADAPMNWTDTEAEIQEQRDFEYYRGIVENAPTADVAEVKHGEWEHLGNRFANCSNCGTIFEALPTLYAFEVNNIFCRHCGAKMHRERNF